MSGDSVVFDINGDPKGAEAAFARLQKELDKSKAKVGELTAEARKSALAGDKLGDAFAKSGKQGEAMAMGFAKSMAGAVTATALLNAALRVTKAEYDNIIQRQQKASQTIIGTANSEMTMLRNVSPQDHAYWRGQVGGMAQRTGQTVASVQQAIADASSAQGNQSNDQLRRNVELAMMVSPDNPADAQTIAGGLGDAVGLTGSMDERVNMGAILAMGKQTRIRSTPKIAERLIPGAISVKGYGGTATEAMAINTTLSTLMNDASGEKTPGSASRIASELDRIYGEKGSPLEHITALQNNPALLKKWYEGTRKQPKGSIPEHAEIAFKNLVTKGSDADKLLRSNLGGFGTDADMGKLTGDWLASAYNSSGQKLAGLDRAMAQTADSLENADSLAGRTGAMRKRVDDTLASAGASWMERTGYAMKFNVQTGRGMASPELAAVGTLAQYRESVRNSPNLTDKQRADMEPLMQILDARIKEMVAELKGLRTDNKTAKPKNVDGHID